MKKILLVTLALALVLLGAGVMGCKTGISVGGNGEATVHIPDSDGGGDVAITGLGSEGKTPEDFGDIPIYPGCKQLIKMVGSETWEGEPGVLDHRMYITTDSPDKVVKFYKQKMPGNGWTEDSWMEGDNLNLGSYTKDTAAAVISAVPADAQGGTNIQIDRKSKK
jgi:hypothetical protein